MRLIFIYGPPAAGKLTVAEELSKLTGIKVFHNHMTLDLGEELFDWRTKPFEEVVDGTRMLVFETAAKHGTDLIFTYCYAHPMDGSWIRNIVDIIEKHGGEVHFVQLICPKEVLEQRVELPDRKRFRKVSSVESLQGIMEKYDLYTPIPFVEHLQIDSSCIEPRETAEMIVQYYGLYRSDSL